MTKKIYLVTAGDNVLNGVKGTHIDSNIAFTKSTDAVTHKAAIEGYYDWVVIDVIELLDTHSPSATHYIETMAEAEAEAVSKWG